MVSFYNLTISFNIGELNFNPNSFKWTIAEFVFLSSESLQIEQRGFSLKLETHFKRSNLVGNV